MVNQKSTFWQAFLVAGIIFWIGLLLGISFESWRADKMAQSYSEAEILLLDSIAQTNFVSSNDTDCSIAANSLETFADDVYKKASNLEVYDSNSRLSEEKLKPLHKKYDLLRTILFWNSERLSERCNLSFNRVVYLYNYKYSSAEESANNVVWSKSLETIKERKGSAVILIPIAVDMDISSVDLMLEKYGVKKFPAVIVDKNVFYDIDKLNSYFS